jgi:hypothetical protein
LDSASDERWLHCMSCWNGHMKSVPELTHYQWWFHMWLLFSLNVTHIVKTEDQFGFHDIFIIITNIWNVILTVKMKSNLYG